MDILPQDLSWQILLGAYTSLFGEGLSDTNVGYVTKKFKI